MIKFKLDLTLEEMESRGDKSGVLVTGPFEVNVNGTNVKPAEVLGIAEALNVAIEKLMPQIENLPGHGPLEFAEALNRSLMNWAEKN